MAFAGTAGGNRSEAGNMVPGFGSSAVHNTKSFASTMTPTATTTPAHFYIFTIVSITLYRAVARGTNFISVFRTAT